MPWKRTHFNSSKGYFSQFNSSYTRLSNQARTRCRYCQPKPHASKSLSPHGGAEQSYIRADQAGAYIVHSLTASAIDALEEQLHASQSASA